MPLTLALGHRRALLLQVAVAAVSCAAYLVAPRFDAVQLYGWVVFRVASAMAVSTMLPFVGGWFPRRVYGRVFALLFSGFQLGYLFASYYWQPLLSAGRLPWQLPMSQCALGFALLLVACAAWLRELPPPPPQESKGRLAERAADAAGANRGDSGGGGARQRAPPVELGRLLRKVATRWVFWAMLLAAGSYSPAVEYSTHVTSYLKEMVSDAGPAKGAFVCMQSSLCEGRYR